tara:strand:- start:155 stop:514 length:360 start_codon:yes stop_codon:yes gene_type:complete
MRGIDINKKFTLFTEHWSPRVIAELNDYQIKIVKIQGEFVWHSHENTDEMFLVVEGEMGIEFEDHTVILQTGEMHIVPKGIRHKPFAKNECKVMLIEPKGVVNTGDANSDKTAENDVWV